MLGQTLIVTAVYGWTQCEDGKKVGIRAGGFLLPPGHKHSHSATATTPMPHIDVQEALDSVNMV